MRDSTRETSTETGGDVSDPGEPLDRMFGLLGDSYRRRVLVHVHEGEGADDAAVEIGEMAAASENAERLRAKLHHVHLPKLASAGYVTWDDDRGVVRPGPNFDEVAPLVRLLRDHREDLPDGAVPDTVS